MYIWDSEFLKQYRTGYIIIEAKSVEEARQKAYEYFMKEYLLDEDELDVQGYIEGWDDDHYGNYLIEKRHIFMEDISKEPIVADYIFINGSE